MSFSILRLFILWKKIRLRLFRAPQEWSTDHQRIIARHFPKVIWMYWGQGLKEAPPIVQACVKSWQHHNPDWDVVVLDDTRLAEFISTQAPDHVPRQAFSDWLRITLLHQHGGVWADATMLCMRPLDDWLPPLMQSGFFAFDNPGPDRIISSWFLACEADHPIPRKWADASNRYLQTVKKPDVYFWFHYTFEWLTYSDASLRRLWNMTPRINAEGPLQAQKSVLAGEQTEPDWNLPTVPMFKLNWRTELTPDAVKNWLRQPSQE